MTELPDKPVITIFGAGLVGCYVGGMLASRGNDVRFFGRKKFGNQASKYGMAFSSHDKPLRTIAGKNIKWICDAQELASSDLILVCVKSTDTANAAKMIDQHCKIGATIISFQNGIGNANTLRQNIKDQTVLAAMVGFNIVRFDDQQLRYHCGTEGEIIIENHIDSQYLIKKLNDADIAARTDNNIQSILWGKLLLNLNNGVNVLSDLPLKQQLENRYYRKILALCIEEALGVINLSGIKPAKIGKVKPELIPALLRLPNFIFKMLAGSMLKIDEDARSSMWEDFATGRRSEIDYLNGAVCRLGADQNRPTPVNDKIVELVNLKFEGTTPNFSSAQDMYDIVLHAKHGHGNNQTA
jgi:2-dehydropantoate 2-reductase